MSNRIVLWLIRFFNEEEHAMQFLSGSLYLNRLSYFKKIEDSTDNTRRDPAEAVFGWFQKDDVFITIENPRFGEIKISPKDLTRPVSLALSGHDNLHIYCMYAIHVPSYAPNELGKIVLSDSDVEKLRDDLRIDDRCKEFGKIAVIVRADTFQERLRETLQSRGQWFNGQLVEYYDDETFSGQFMPDEAPFRKQMRFSHQQEFRIAVNTKTQGNDPLRIEMGDIRDIATQVDYGELDGVFRINFEEV